ncbi:hypothetical protein PRIPAC_96655 [Pristionchus pacificus]|uniref:Uncharacterized protein n=1 Tax=Pristionchus pacificus TaxID=54126 RepID=A0A2A6B308_PRIPA|nr:hypothetical protein PRIPAC_96655 [Pristionchus pacificus]|eukprot:PDM60267.1 hypothetical protein PRIPAC_54092 [Pristionchus pacificus]
MLPVFAFLGVGAACLIAGVGYIAYSTLTGNPPDLMGALDKGDKGGANCGMVTLESASLASVTTDSIAVLTQTRKASSVFGKHCTTVHLVNNFATLISTVIGSVAELTPCNLPLLRGSSTLRAVLRDGSDISRILLLEHAAKELDKVFHDGLNGRSHELRDRGGFIGFIAALLNCMVIRGRSVVIGGGGEDWSNSVGRSAGVLLLLMDAFSHGVTTSLLNSLQSTDQPESFSERLKCNFISNTSLFFTMVMMDQLLVREVKRGICHSGTGYSFPDDLVAVLLWSESSDSFPLISPS